MADKNKTTDAAVAAIPFRQAAQKLELWRAARTEAETVAINLDCIRFHCEAFDLERDTRTSNVLGRFQDVVRAAGTGVIESSVKVAGSTQHAARFNILCSPADKTSFLEEMFRFVRDVERSQCTTLDVQPVKNMLAGADLDSVTRMVCGVDIREQGSRIKIWVFADHQPGNPDNPVERALSLGLVDRRFHAMHVHPQLLLGYDLAFGGDTALKIYPDIWEHELANPAVRARLEPILTEVDLRRMSEAYWTHFYLRGGEKGLILDLHLKDPDDFVVRHLSNRAADRIHGAYRGVPMLDVVAAAPSYAATGSAIEDFTLYYMPAHV